jgi:hypothetical protein
MERWVRTCRHELLDRTLIWNQRHLLHAPHEFESFYNGHRSAPGTTTASADHRHGPTTGQRSCQRTGPTTNHPQWTYRRIFPGSVGQTGFAGGTRSRTAKPCTAASSWPPTRECVPRRCCGPTFHSPLDHRTAADLCDRRSRRGDVEPTLPARTARPPRHRRAQIPLHRAFLADRRSVAGDPADQGRRAAPPALPGHGTLWNLDTMHSPTRLTEDLPAQRCPGQPADQVVVALSSVKRHVPSWRSNRFW